VLDSCAEFSQTPILRASPDLPREVETVSNLEECPVSEDSSNVGEENAKAFSELEEQNFNSADEKDAGNLGKMKVMKEIKKAKKLKPKKPLKKDLNPSVDENLSNVVQANGDLSENKTRDDENITEGNSSAPQDIKSSQAGLNSVKAKSENVPDNSSKKSLENTSNALKQINKIKIPIRHHPKKSSENLMYQPSYILMNSDEQEKLVQAVFNYWKTVMNHPKALLDKNRRGMIVDALEAGYPLDDIKQAIDGCALTPFNMGINNQNRYYDDLTLILRDATHIEGFIDRASRPPCDETSHDQSDSQYELITAGMELCDEGD